MIFYLIFLSMLLIVEGAVVIVPLVLSLLIAITVIQRNTNVFVIALFAGIVLDIFSMRVLGTTGLFFISVLCLVLLYERKFEITTWQFVFFATFISANIYLLLFGQQYILPHALMSAIVAAMFFRGLYRLQKLQAREK